MQELYDYLRTETDYPIDLIWKNMIRTMHPHDFTRNLALTRIIAPTVQDTAMVQDIRKNRRIALAMHLYFMDMLDSSKAFAAKFRRRRMFSSRPAAPTKSRRLKPLLGFAGAQRHRDCGGKIRGRDVAAFLCDLAPTAGI